jgi:hypothetical protein
VTATFGWGGGMEHQTCTSMLPGLVSNGLGSINVHELAHQWFGDSVTCHHYDHIWLNEGFATYSEALFYEWNAGGDPATYHNYVDNNYFAGDSYPLVGPQADQFSGNMIYDRGAWVLHMLRGVLGDPDFFQAVRNYHEAYKYSTAVTEDLQQVVEDTVGGGADFSWFFTQWLYWRYRPTYEWSWNEHTEGSDHYVDIYIEQTQDDPVYNPSNDPYIMPIPFQVTDGASSATTFKVWNNQRSQQGFKINLGSLNPSSVTFDYMNWVLEYSSQVSPPPVTPNNPGSNNALTDRITWTWNDSSNNEQGFRLWIGAGASAPAGNYTHSTSSNAGSYQVTGLLPNTLYAFQAAAYNSNGTSTKTTNYSTYTGIENVAGLEFTSVGASSIAFRSTNTPSNLAAGFSGLLFSNKTTGSNSGWVKSNSPWTSIGLSPNTLYTLAGNSRNGVGTNTGELTVQKYTLAAAPTVGQNLSCNRTPNTVYGAGTDFTFSNPAGFGPGTHGSSAKKVTYYKYEWNQSPSHTFTGAETGLWNSATLSLSPGTSGEYYLHIQSYNEDDIANAATLSYGPFVFDNDPPISSSAADLPTKVEGAIEGNYSASDTGPAGLDYVNLMVRRNGESWSSAGEVTGGRFSYTPPGDGIYYFYTLAVDRAGNSETAPGGSGDSMVIYNDIANSSMALEIVSAATYTFPMEDGLNVKIAFSTLTGTPETVTVSRTQSPASLPGTLDPAKFIAEMIVIDASTAGDFTARILWDYQLANSLTPAQITEAVRDKGGVLTTFPDVTSDGSTITIENVTGFSGWYAGSTGSGVENWMLY